MRICIALLIIAQLLFPSLSSAFDDFSAENAGNYYFYGNSSFKPIPKSSSPIEDSGTYFFKSFLLPGWGQYSRGNHLGATAYFSIELFLLSGFTAQLLNKKWLESDYRDFAQQHAFIHVGTFKHRFYVDIGNWNDRESYNFQRVRERRFDDMYTSNFDWNWDSKNNREHFKSLRISADRAGQNLYLFAGCIFLNHFISAIDAKRYSSSLRFSPHILPSFENGFILNLLFQ